MRCGRQRKDEAFPSRSPFRVLHEMFQTILLRPRKPFKRVAASEQGAQVREPGRVFLRTTQGGDHWGVSRGSVIPHHNVRNLVGLYLKILSGYLTSPVSCFFSRKQMKDRKRGKYARIASDHETYPLTMAK